MTGGDWASAVSAAVAVVSAVVSAIAALRSRKAKAEAAEQAAIATKAAVDTAAAEQRAAAAAERSATAHETRASVATGRVAAAELRPWRIEAIPGSENCYLHNQTARMKYGVRIEGEAVRQSDVGIVDGKASVEIDTLLSVWGMDKRVTVTWHLVENLSDEQLSWTTHLPERIR